MSWRPEFKTDPLLLAALQAREVETCRNMAEDFFKAKKFDSALFSIQRAFDRLFTIQRQFDRNLKTQALMSLHACYLVHKHASETKNWYAVLEINHRGAGIDEIKKRYDHLSELLRPVVCPSVGVTVASMLVEEAWDVLSDPRRREAYDALIGGKFFQTEKNQGPENSNGQGLVGADNNVTVNLNSKSEINQNFLNKSILIDNLRLEALAMPGSSTAENNVIANLNSNLEIKQNIPNKPALIERPRSEALAMPGSSTANNKVVVNLNSNLDINQNIPDKPTLIERLRREALAMPGSSTSPSQRSSLHKTKKILIVKKKLKSGKQIMVVTPLEK